MHQTAIRVAGLRTSGWLRASRTAALSRTRSFRITATMITLPGLPRARRRLQNVLISGSHRIALRAGLNRNRLHGGATRDETAPRVRAAALVNARCQAAERSDLLTFHASKLGQFRQQRACSSLRYSFALAHDGFLEDDLRIAAFVQREFHPDRDELGLQMSNHALDRGLRRSDRSGLASTLLGMERRLELTMARNQRIQHHIFSSPKAQFSGIETIAPKIAQQPCIDGIGLGLDTLNLAKCLHSRRMHDCPRNAGCAQRGFKVALVTTATLEHDEVATGIECGNQYRYIHGLIPVPPDARRTLARHIDPTLADIDTNHSLALHADLHHVSRVRTEHSIVCGCSPIYRSCSGPQKPAGLQISTVVETLRDLEVPPALPSVEGRDQHTIRDRERHGVCAVPGSAAHHFVLRCARDTLAVML